MFSRRVRVFYPLSTGRMVLRTSNDWQRDLEPVRVDAGASRFDFEVTSDRSFLELKPCIRGASSFRWSVGANKLVILSSDESRDVYPYFDPGRRSWISERHSFPSEILGRSLEIRVYTPAGYDENQLKRYPVIYMHDGRNLFFPEEAFLGREWQVDETLDRLDSMSLIDQTIVVGIHSGERFFDYTAPGYEAFGRALVEELKPTVDRVYRTLGDARETAIMGSSLGGVAAFHLAWQWPDVFGNAACLSSTFGYRDDLIRRVRQDPVEPRRHLRVYLDSGWPRDNYEATLGMAFALKEAGFEPGRNLLHLAFPLARHHEGSWAARCHLPIQLFSGRLTDA